MRFFGRAMGGLFLAAVTLALLALAVGVVLGALRERMAADGPATPVAERVVSANVLRVEAGRIVPVLTAYGEVRSVRTLELRAPVAGRVVELAPGFADGGMVPGGRGAAAAGPGRGYGGP